MTTLSPLLGHSTARRLAAARSRYERLARSAPDTPEAALFLKWIRDSLDNLEACHARWQQLLDQVEADLDDLDPDPPHPDPDPARN